MNLKQAGGNSENEDDMDINALLPPLAGSFVGAIAGVAVNNLYQSHKNREDKKKYKKLIKSEIELCLKVLKSDTVKLLPIEKWNSIVNSGALRLFNADIELSPLSESYYQIQFYNGLIGFSKDHDWDWDFMPDEIKEQASLLQSNLERLKDAEWFK